VIRLAGAAGLVLAAGAGWVLGAPRDGPRVVTERYASGELSRRAEYQNGKLDGITRGWYQNGRLMYEYHYRRGLGEGLQRQWNRDGTLLLRLNQHQGHEAGLQQMWNLDGSVRSSYVIRNGKRYGLLGARGCTGRNLRQQ
jgi:antitoxin component YwqK of YwqJK toxin-antitoxin module